MLSRVCRDGHIYLLYLAMDIEFGNKKVEKVYEPVHKFDNEPTDTYIGFICQLLINILCDCFLEDVCFS